MQLSQNFDGAVLAHCNQPSQDKLSLRQEEPVKVLKRQMLVIFHNCASLLKSNHLDKCPSKNNVVFVTILADELILTITENIEVDQPEGLDEILQFETNIFRQFGNKEDGNKFGVFASRTVWNRTA